MARRGNGWKKYNHYIPDETIELIRYLASVRNLTSSDVVRAALLDYSRRELQNERSQPAPSELLSQDKLHASQEPTIHFDTAVEEALTPEDIASPADEATITLAEPSRAKSSFAGFE